MDRYDELNAELNAAIGMEVETALKIKAASTILVLVGPHSEQLADVRALALNDDGSERYDVAALAAEIADFWPQAIATVALWRQRYAASNSNDD